MCDVLDGLLGLNQNKHVIVEDASFTRHSHDSWMDVTLKIKVPQSEAAALFDRLASFKATVLRSDVNVFRKL